ncbi:3Fe-4S ferredoxin [Pseudomonas oryzihabitans]|nr:3Fe-4S ferredoxin [Pseudomonas psychrotolerans]KTT40003.1 3Fe-4S ferredoxin [Pseudomonas psychrotolerans]KTT43817.1 3Fe-4S ferredoxin [Pseudomonas psychrotolerans]KTT64553.1 3Fe-4S ferredoxin [Pseudomonas psychrotolerans]
MRVVVDQSLCGTTGQCVLTLPDIFRQREADGIAEVCLARIPEELHEAVRLAASQCPVAAIRIIEDREDDPVTPGHELMEMASSSDRHGADDEAT